MAILAFLITSCNSDHKKQVFDEDGKLLEEGSLINDAKEGKWISYHENGIKKSEVHFQNNIEEGPFQFWYNTGKKQMQGLSKNGKFVWVEEFYPNGNYSSAISFHPPGVKNDTLKTWYPNGQIQVLGKYFNNKKSGVWKNYLENGRLFLTQHFYNDTLLKKEQNFDANFIRLGNNSVKTFTLRQALTYYTDTFAKVNIEILDRNGNVLEKDYLNFESSQKNQFKGLLVFQKQQYQLEYIDDFMIQGVNKDYKILKFSSDDYTLFFNEYYGLISWIDRKNHKIYQLENVGPGMIHCYQEVIDLFYQSDFYIKS